MGQGEKRFVESSLAFLICHRGYVPLNEETGMDFYSNRLTG